MAELLSGKLICAIGNDLVGVHIGLGAGSCLPDDQRELFHQIAGNHLITCRFDHFEFFIRHTFRYESVIGLRGSFFQNSERMNDLCRHRLDTHADRKILMTALCLCAPQSVCGHLHFTH